MQNHLLRRAVSQLARGLDRVFTGTALQPPSFLTGRAGGKRGKHRDRATPLDHDKRLRTLQLFASFYGRPAFLTTENALLPRPGRIHPQLTRVRSFGSHGEVLDLRWTSEFEPLWSRASVEAHLASLPPDERAQLSGPAELDLDRTGDVPEKYLRAQANRTAHARWFKHTGDRSRPRPCVVLIHGYMAGHYALEERIWQVRRLFDSGLDVMLTVLPLHGPRRAESRGYRPPAFPSSDTRFTIEGFRQVVFDHRALFDYLRSVGVREQGVMGMSLGGYSAGLLATLEPQLRFAVLVVPLAAIEDFAHGSGRMPGSDREQLALRDALQRAQAPISPLSRTSLVPNDRVIVVAGEADLVTGVTHARKLSEHFGAHLSFFHGGHLLHAGREQALVPVWRLLGAFASSGLAQD